jgi:uncharacterized lipoprotein YmbA
MRLTAILLLALTVTALGASGCGGSKPSRHYRMMPLAEEAVASRDIAEDAVRVGVARVGLPDYLKRPQIVSLSRVHGLTVAEFDRWAEPLEQNVGDVVSRNLAALLPEMWVMHPWAARPEVDLVVRIQVMEFEARGDGQMHFAAEWSVSGMGAEEALVRRITASTLPLSLESGDDDYYDSVAAIMSEQLAELSREIAEVVGGAGK